jgi:hypothetical protein
VGEQPSTMGVQPTTSVPPDGETNFVGPSAWRTPSGDVQPTSPADPNTTDYSLFYDPNSTEQGAHLFSIAPNGFSQTIEGRGKYWTIRTTENIYRPWGQEPTDDSFASGEVRHFHEPVYVIDIIREDAIVATPTVTEWVNTGAHIARERTIGVYENNATDLNGNPHFLVELFHARVGDAVPRFADEDRFVYVRVPGEPDQRWMCVNISVYGGGMVDTMAQFATIVADINANGFWNHPDGLPVHGLYEYTEDIFAGPHSIHRIRIGQYIGQGMPQPPVGSRIIVKYDKREPIIAHGGPCTIAPHVFAPIDRSYNGLNGFTDITNNTVFWNSAPLPYPGGIRTIDYDLPKNSSSTVPLGYHHTLSMRQWVIYAELVTRCPGRLVTGDVFPRKHYVMRPAQIVSYGDANGNGAGALNGFHDQYDIDYPGEGPSLNMGGFRFWNEDPLGYNLDYSKQPLVSGLGVPVGTGNPQRHLCASYIASERFNPVAEDNPGYRTFRFDNMYHCSEENGGIMMIHALDQGGNTNLFGFCWKGVHMVPYNKNTLSVDDNGTVIATQSVGSFWPKMGMEHWIARGEKGCPGAAWRSAVKFNGPMGGADGDSVVWPDRKSIYRLMGGQIIDIARGKRRKKFITDDNSGILQLIPDTYQGKYASIYSPNRSEVWMQFDSTGSGPQPPEPRPAQLHVFNVANNEWVGTFTYEYDSYNEIEGQVIGYRELTANDLDTGLVMADDTPVECWAEQTFTPFPSKVCEMVKWRIYPDKPDEYRLYDRDHVQMVIQNQALQEAFEAGTGQFWVLNIDGWEQFFNCADTAYDALRQQPQATRFYLRFYHRTESDFKISVMEVQPRLVT